MGQISTVGEDPVHYWIRDLYMVDSAVFGVILPSGPRVMTSGIQVHDGVVNVQSADDGGASLIIGGDSGITRAAVGFHLDGGVVENDGTMAVSSGHLDTSDLGGHGRIQAIDSYLTINSCSSADETIQLDRTSLYVGSYFDGPADPGMSFLAPVTMDQASFITLLIQPQQARLSSRAARRRVNCFFITT